ncbi:MAG: hypothetical protein HY361_02075 [Candidatus Aenigmarchaeota archaeon]|nr:hypothetical protein [Candidatus Aenigmarchaeota archaeon]
MTYKSSLPQVALGMVNRLRRRHLLDGVRLSFHRSDSGLEVVRVDDKTLEEFLYENTGMVLYLHGIKPAKESWHQINGLSRPIYNAVTIELCKYLPYLPFFDKNQLYRSLGIKIGRNTTIAPRVQFDYFHPELIEIGDNCIIGDGARIWTHDYGPDYFMVGKVVIGNNVLVGSESVIWPSTIGNNVRINFGAFVYGMTVPANATVLGRERSRYEVDK